MRGVRGWAKVVVLVLLPINAWLFVFLYLNYQKAKYLGKAHYELIRDEARLRKFLQEKYGLRVGQRLLLPLSKPFIGLPPSVGQGYPICFINISGLILSEVWEPAIVEALKSSPYLYVVLLHPSDGDVASVKEIVQKVGDPRLSAVYSDLAYRGLGGYRGGVLLILCDGNGIVRAVEPYPPLKISPRWEEEVADWRPKLHQAVKKVLDKFFPKGQGR